jgi:hypothetical protein
MDILFPGESRGEEGQERSCQQRPVVRAKYHKGGGMRKLSPDCSNDDHVVSCAIARVPKPLSPETSTYSAISLSSRRAAGVWNIPKGQGVHALTGNAFPQNIGYLSFVPGRPDYPGKAHCRSLHFATLRSG